MQSTRDLLAQNQKINKRDQNNIRVMFTKVIERLEDIDARVTEVERQSRNLSDAQRRLERRTPPSGVTMQHLEKIASETSAIEWQEDSSHDDDGDDPTLIVEAATKFVEASEKAREEAKEAEAAADEAGQEAKEAEAAADEASEALSALASVINDKAEGKGDEVAAALAAASQKKSTLPDAAAAPGVPSSEGDAAVVAEEEAAEEGQETHLSEQDLKTVERYFMQRTASIRRKMTALSPSGKK